jgi:hypothetical protein
VDASFLRHRDELSRASVLVAEWPPRIEVADSDPPAVVLNTGADPLLAQCEQSRRPVVISPGPPRPSWWRRLAGPTETTPPSVVAAPLVSGEVTTGVLGFVKFGARKWKQSEINTLEAVAALFAQLQARLAAEEKLRYLAEHDDLTGLYNRRALVAHLSERLAAGKPGPVAVLYLDLVHQGLRATHSGLRRESSHDRPAGWRRVRRRARAVDVAGDRGVVRPSLVEDAL